MPVHRRVRGDECVEQIGQMRVNGITGHHIATPSNSSDINCHSVSHSSATPLNSPSFVRGTIGKFTVRARLA